MSGEPERPSSETGRESQSRQKLPAASPPTLPAKPERGERSAAATYAGVGLQFAVTLLICVWLGTWLDRKFGTTPVFLYLGVFLGAGGAFYSMYRQLMTNLERDEREKRARKTTASSAHDESSPGGSQ